VPLFDEVLTPVPPAPRCATALGRALARRRPGRADAAGRRRPPPSAEYLSWRHWLRLHAPAGLEPRGWIYLNFTYQQIQAALAGQGVALARVALVHEIAGAR
jgi:LysR family glycine cleavage system transcriptional activator